MTDSEKIQFELLNLLAVLHRDGGHHTDRVGLLQSIVDAKESISSNERYANALDEGFNAANGRRSTVPESPNPYRVKK